MYKQVILVRTDLKMGKGKIASQVAHASLLSFLKTDKSIREKWLNEGMKKVVLKVKNEKELLFYYEKAKKLEISCSLIRDAAKTQLDREEFTAVGIGPDEEEKIDKITGNLKLL